jgi:hypothetical protein
VTRRACRSTRQVWREARRCGQLSESENPDARDGDLSGDGILFGATGPAAPGQEQKGLPANARLTSGLCHLSAIRPHSIFRQPLVYHMTTAIQAVDRGAVIHMLWFQEEGVRAA